MRTDPIAPLTPPKIDAEELLAQAQWVQRLARSLVRDASVAEDLVQETWLAALGRAPSDEGRLRPWLARVVRNFARQSRRGEANRARREEVSARSESSPSASDTAERLEAQRLLVEALAALDEPYRTTVTMRYLEGLSAAQIARRQKIPAGTVRWRLKQGLDELRARLDQRFGGERSSWAVALLPLLHRPPLAEIAIQLARNPSGSASALVEGVIMMNTFTKIGIAAALVLTASVGIWISVDRPKGPLDPTAAREPSAPALALAAPTIQETSGFLAPSTFVEARENAGEAPASVAVPAPTSASTKARLEARFLDASSLPLRGVRFEVLAEAGSKSESGADGRARLEVEIPEESGHGSVQASCPGRATLFEAVILDRGQTTQLGDRVLEIGGAVAGVVLGPDGTPASDAEVFVTKPELVDRLEAVRRLGPVRSPGVPSGRTGKDGSFWIDGVAARSVRVWSGAEGMRYSLTDPVDVPPGETKSGLMLTLEPLAPEDVIEGVVLAPDGAPVPSASVSCYWNGTYSSGGFAMGAGADGRFRIKVRERVPHDLRAVDPDGRWPQVLQYGVAPGTPGVVLRFSEPGEFELLVRGEKGTEIRSFSVAVLTVDTENYLDSTREAERPGGRITLRVPLQPFLVDVYARGYAKKRLGPLDPKTVPPSLECELVPLPGVRGRVVAAGHPVSDARIAVHELAHRQERIVSDGFLTRLNPHIVDRVTSDAEGRFVLTVRDPGEYSILCEAAGFATAEISPLSIDPARGEDGLEIVMSPGGSIEGRVLLPGGRDPIGIIVGVSRGDGQPRTVRVGSDGSFRFERLTPGRWRVTRAAHEVREYGEESTFNVSDREVVFTGNCVVDEGRTTRFDLDLRDDLPCVFSGHVSVDGQPAAAWTLTLRMESGEDSPAQLPGGALDGQGNVRVEVPGPGIYRVELRPPPRIGDDESFSQSVQLARGENPWPLALTTGRLEGRVGSAIDVGPDRAFWYGWKGAGDLEFCARFSPDAEGQFHVPLVPVGPGTLRRLEGEDRRQMRWVTVREVEIAAGETQRVDLP